MSTIPGRHGGPDTAVAADIPGGRSGPAPLLVTLVDGELSEVALATARTIAAGTDAPLLVLNAVCVPEQTPPSLPAARPGSYHEQTRRVLDTIADVDPDLRTSGAVHVGHRLVDVVAGAVESYGASGVVVDEQWTRGRLAPLVPTALDRLARTIDRVVVFPTGGPLPEAVPSILVPVAGGPHSGVATDVARTIALVHDAHVDLLHVATGDTDPERAAEEYLRPARRRLRDCEDVETRVLEAENAAEAIVEQSHYYDVTVVGGPRSSRLGRFVFGSTARDVRDRAGNAVVTARR